MADQIATFLAKRFIGDRAGNYFKHDDPYFEATADTPGGKKSKPKKKALPPGLSERDAKVLKKVRRRAYRMDRAMSCCCCGFRFGWSAVIGIIPVIGDILDMLIALSIIRTCMEVELPKHIIAQMYTNLALDFGIGLVPILGDFADAWFKCNTRNNLLLEKFLRERGATNPAPPPQPKQSTMRRWFGPGPHAPENHPDQPVGTVVATTADSTPSGSSHSTGPPVPPKNGTGSAPKLSGRGRGTDGGRGIVEARQRDLEAQVPHDNGAIHYSREG